jgi:hypothetical protein
VTPLREIQLESKSDVGTQRRACAVVIEVNVNTWNLVRPQKTLSKLLRHEL